MHVTRLMLNDFRNYERVDLAIADGITVFHGPVGAGKTNLLEALYLGCAGRSLRTSNGREIVRFGQQCARVEVAAFDDGLERRFEVALDRAGTRLAKADGERAGPHDLRARPLVCAFVPDRIELVKGAAGLRRAHLDSFIVALWPAREETRKAYARALAQRNALLARVRAGAPRSALASWNRELSRQGIALMGNRVAAVELLSDRFVERAQQLGLEEPAALSYRPRSHARSAEQLEEELAETLERDLERGFTTHGPHRDDLRFSIAGRELRRFGSQGQQRIALLALLLAERDALKTIRGNPPLLLLDDVLSELDSERRHRLLSVVAGEGQTVITTADLEALDGWTDSTTLVEAPPSLQSRERGPRV